MRAKRKIPKVRLSRRRWLIGSGASIALPFLPGLPLAQEVEAQANSAKRLMVFFVPEGVYQSTWFSQGLAPLSSRRSQFSVVRGMNHRVAADTIPGGQDLHAPAPNCILSGGQGPDRSFNGVNVPGGQTIDRVVGRVLADPTTTANYNLGARSDPSKFSGVGPDRGWVSYERWNNHRPAVDNPVRTFNDLIGASGTSPGTNPGTGSAAQTQRLAALRRRQSVLDSLVPELQEVRCELSYDGRSKLESHLTAVREIEVELGRLIAAEETGGTPAPAPGPQLPTPSVDPSWGQESFYVRNNNAFESIVPLQAQIAALALASGSLQCATLTLGHSVSQQRYPWINGIRSAANEGYHEVAHRQEGHDLSLIDQWFSEKFDQTLGWLEEYGALDNTLLLYCSEMAHGNHGVNNMPFLIAGMGDRFRLGEDFDAGGRNHNDLLTAILQGFGIDAGRIGSDGYNRGAYTEILR